MTMQRFATYSLYTAFVLLGVLTGRGGADGRDHADVANQAYTNDLSAGAGLDAKYVDGSGSVRTRGFLHAGDEVSLARRRVRRSGLDLDDDHYAWALYGGLIVLVTIFFLSVVCWCAHWSAWIRSADGLTLFRDHSSPMHLAYPTYDNLAFSSYMEKNPALGDGIIVNGGYYEKSPNVHTYMGPRVDRCSESIV